MNMHASYVAFLEECNASSLDIKQSENLAKKCSFKSGGDAMFYCAPKNEKELQCLLSIADAHTIEVYVLGGGSNVLIPDDKLDALVIHLNALEGIEIEENNGLCAHIFAGTDVRKACEILANKGFQGIDFLYGMPGSIGGACYMNARCYGKEISDVIIAAEGFAFDGSPWKYEYKEETKEKDFSYKQSPFPSLGVISRCTLRLERNDISKIWEGMLALEMDRHHKGHYLAPCAGSVFKNNRNFGEPSGKILDSLHWRGKGIQGAIVSPHHANIIINVEQATSKNIYNLLVHMQQSVKETYGYELEPEVVALGKKEQWLEDNASEVKIWSM